MTQGKTAVSKHDSFNAKPLTADFAIGNPSQVFPTGVVVCLKEDTMHAADAAFVASEMATGTGSINSETQQHSASPIMPLSCQTMNQFTIMYKIMHKLTNTATFREKTYTSQQCLTMINAIKIIYFKRTAKLLLSKSRMRLIGSFFYKQLTLRQTLGCVHFVFTSMRRRLKTAQLPLYGIKKKKISYFTIMKPQRRVTQTRNSHISFDVVETESGFQWNN